MSPDALILAHSAPKCIWRPGSARIRWGSLQRSPRPPIWLAGFKGAYRLLVRERDEKEGQEREGPGRGGELRPIFYPDLGG